MSHQQLQAIYAKHDRNFCAQQAGHLSTIAMKAIKEINKDKLSNQEKKDHTAALKRQWWKDAQHLFVRQA